MLTFVIPTYNEEAHIEKLLSLLRPQLAKGDEIVVVDSYSKDGTARIAKKHGCRVVMQQKRGDRRRQDRGS